MTPEKTPGKPQHHFFLIIIASAYVTSIGFGMYYYSLVGSGILFQNCMAAFSIHLLVGITSFFTNRLVFLFRVSILVALGAFFVQTYYTGGALSPSLSQFVIVPILALFYPGKDRYFFLVGSIVCVVFLLILTVQGRVENLIPPEYITTNNAIVTIFVFFIITVYSFLHRAVLSKKNQELRMSLEELKHATQKLIQSEKMVSLGIMSAGVAHEINNPLNFIKGGVDVLFEKLGKSSEHTPYLKAIQEGVKRASTIVHSMKHFSTSTLSMDEECDLQDIIENCLIMLQHLFKYRIKITKDYTTDGGLKITGNEGRIHQAMLNILSNAEQAIKGKGEIKIQTRLVKNHIIITISDTGVGISKENLKRISDPFFTTKPIGEGTGLGLAISYQIMHEHGAKVSVLSEVGYGSEFTLSFPPNKRIK